MSSLVGGEGWCCCRLWLGCQAVQLRKDQAQLIPRYTNLASHVPHVLIAPSPGSKFNNYQEQTMNMG